MFEECCWGSGSLTWELKRYSIERNGAFLVSLIPICNLTSSLRMDVEDICQSIQVVWYFNQISFSHRMYLTKKKNTPMARNCVLLSTVNVWVCVFEMFCSELWCALSFFMVCCNLALPHAKCKLFLLWKFERMPFFYQYDCDWLFSSMFTVMCHDILRPGSDF